MGGRWHRAGWQLPCSARPYPLPVRNTPVPWGHCLWAMGLLGGAPRPALCPLRSQPQLVPPGWLQTRAPAGPPPPLPPCPACPRAACWGTSRLGRAGSSWPRDSLGGCPSPFWRWWRCLGAAGSPLLPHQQCLWWSRGPSCAQAGRIVPTAAGCPQEPLSSRSGVGAGARGRQPRGPLAVPRHLELVWSPSAWGCPGPAAPSSLSSPASSGAG